ncbi:MAG: imelysin family protein [Chromatiales bacterium]|jgi:predicted lipoprotein
MTRFFYALCAVLLFPTLAMGANSSALNLAAVDHYIIPGYQALADSTVKLESRTHSFCTSGSEVEFTALREAFHHAMDDWQYVQLIRFGPIEILLRGNRYQMWPDKRGTVGKHLRQLLKAKDSDKLASDQFERASIAIQGFSAMERLLFGNDSNPEQFVTAGRATYDCQVLQAIAHNLATMSRELVAEWSQGDNAHRVFIASAADGNDYYEAADEVSSRLLNNLHTALQLIAEQKLERPLGDAIQKARGQRAESWRSRRSLRNIRLNLQAAEKLYQLAFAPRLQDTPLQQQIAAAFSTSRQQIDAIKTSLYAAVNDETARQQVESLQSSAAKLKALLAGPLPDAIGIPLGFNSLDGD